MSNFVTEIGATRNKLSDYSHEASRTHGISEIASSPTSAQKASTRTCESLNNQTELV